MKLSQLIYRGLIVAAILALVSGCNRNSSSGSSVKITDISPSTESTLHVGEKVKLQVKVDYKMEASAGGSINLEVQAADNSNIGHYEEVVKEGSGSLTLETEFVVPDTQVIAVFTPLIGQGESSTSTVDHRSYKVIKN